MGGRGRHDGLNEPTVITTTLNGNVVLDHFNWIPTWPELPPAEIRYEAFSSTFNTLTPAMPQVPMFVSLDSIQARGFLTITQYPSAANNFTTILEFNDNSWTSHDIYSARVIFSDVPEPSVGMLVMAAELLGLVGLFGKITTDAVSGGNVKQFTDIFVSASFAFIGCVGLSGRTTPPKNRARNWCQLRLNFVPAVDRSTISR